MSQFRKKPVVIEAMQWRGSVDGAQLIVAWLQGHGVNVSVSPGWHRVDQINIPTLEGVMTAQPDDWIIRGVKGEFCPCKPDIFAATYELASSAPAPHGEEPMNLRIFRDGGTRLFFIRGEGGSGSGETPEAAMRELVRARNTFTDDQWPVASAPAREADTQAPQGDELLSREIRTLQDAYNAGWQMGVMAERERIAASSPSVAGHKEQQK